MGSGKSQAHPSLRKLNAQSVHSTRQENFMKTLLAALFFPLAVSYAAPVIETAPAIDAAKAAELSQKAYVYGYPLVIVDLTCKVFTATATATDTKAPYNQWVHKRTFPDQTFTEVVKPNVDTLYSTSCLDLSNEPIVLTVPDMGERYYLMPMLDAWSNVFASPGTRTTGNMAGNFAIVGPGWQGTLPEGVQRIDAPTNLVWIIGRTYTAGEADFAAVNAVQDQYKLTPLSAFGTDYVAPTNVPFDESIDAVTSPKEQVEKMSSADFFQRVNDLMVKNPPAAADAPFLAEVAPLNVAPAAQFSADFSAEVLSSIDEGVAKAKESILAENNHMGVISNNWIYFATEMGCYGTNYQLRAVIALAGLGANLPQDAIYPMTMFDKDGERLTGEKNYVLHFDKSQLPPAKAFWSLTMYNEDDFLVGNPLNRFALGDRSDLKYNEDGSLDLYIQKESPGADKEANWLPAPAGRFTLTLRLYWPEQNVIDGKWEVPGVQLVD
jgi:hypothetical protein